MVDVDAARISMNNMDNIAGHSDLPEVVFGNHHKRTREERGISDRKEMMEILSDWYGNEDIGMHWASREKVVQKLIEILRDPNVRCFPLAGSLKNALVNIIEKRYIKLYILFLGVRGK